MDGLKSIDQHRAGLSFDSHPRFAVDRCKGEACGKECVCTRFIDFEYLIERAIVDLEEKHLFSVVLILPRYRCRGSPCFAGDGYDKIADYHKAPVPGWMSVGWLCWSTRRSTGDDKLPRPLALL
jgi:hypothetical protein